MGTAAKLNCATLLINKSKNKILLHQCQFDTDQNCECLTMSDKLIMTTKVIPRWNSNNMQECQSFSLTSD